MDCVQLHVHSHYSLLESTIKVPDLVAKTKELGMSAVAMTDLGNMFGAVDFYLAAKSAGIQPILGAEIYYTAGSRLDKQGSTKSYKRVQTQKNAEETGRLFHLVLLCKDEQGYHNLCEIVTRGYTEGFHFRPRADRELLTRYKDGLICLSAGLKGEIGYHVAQSRPDRAEEAAVWLRDLYRDEFYLEVQETRLPEQAKINRFNTEMAEKLSIPLVGCGEAFYLTPEDAAAQEVLQCIGSGRNLDEARGSRLVPDEHYLKSPAVMQEQLGGYPGALENTMKIASRCGFSFKMKDDKGRQIYHLPNYEVSITPPEGMTPVEAAIRKAAQDGLENRFLEPRFEKMRTAADFAVKREAYDKRLQEELDMIVRTGFAGYFLVVADFIGYAKSKAIPVGPGRGSGAGSIVAFAMGITDIDPIPFNLLFERFINPERISLPDFDVDFCQDRRQEVIDYVVQKYGKEKVSQIITFGKLLARGVIRDVGRVMGLSYGEVDQIAKLVPEELGITLEKAFTKEPRLGELIAKDARSAKLFEVARRLEGVNRHASVHAAGVVITNRPLVEYCPLYTGKEGELVAQFDKDFAEKIGLVKFDFLGLKTLTVIDNAVRFVRETQLQKGVAPDAFFDLSRIDYSDQKVYELIASGDTDGIFQLESSGMKDLCQRVQPNSLEDITAINALYRPGPLNSGMVDDYINRKHGKTPVVYELPQLAEILEETYGVIVYQEQVMRVARVLANYSLGEADILRRAMGKKKPEEMAKQQGKFVEGCKANGIKQETAVKIFDLLAKFAEYGFNKSHSAAYGVLSFQTAYLKTYYPAQFMAALMATEMDNTDKMAQYISDAKGHGIEILPPNVNASQKTFSVVEMPDGKSAVRFGLEAIKGVGGVAVEAILEARRDKGEFRNFMDFCKRVPLRKVNKKVIESLIQVGAFDSIAEQNRATLFGSVEAVIEHAAKVQEESDLGQVSIFAEYKSEELRLENQMNHLFNVVPDWAESKKLQAEKELVGFYVSGHPIDKWWSLAKDFLRGDLLWIHEEFEKIKAGLVTLPNVAPEGSRGKWQEAGPRWDVVVLALVSSFREIITKKGTRMAFVEFEDAKSKIEAVCFPDVYEQVSTKIKQSVDECLPFLISGNVSIDEETPKIFLRGMDLVSEYRSKRIQNVVLRLDPLAVDTHRLAQLRAALVKHRGRCATFLEYTGTINGASFTSRHVLPKELHVDPSAEMKAEVNGLFGKEVVKFS